MEKILITGGNGFLGASLMRILKNKFRVYSLGRKNADYNYNLAEDVPEFERQFKYVIHAAGKAHIVPETEKEKEDFFIVNEFGTKNLLNSLEPIKGELTTFVFISTVSVYGKDEGDNITEEAPLLSNTPYGLSKINAEIIVEKWCNMNNIKCLILRLPLLAGANPPGNLGAMIEGINRNKYLSINKGKAKRSIVLIDDIANMLIDNFDKEGTFNLTDDYNPSFRELEVLISRQLKKKKPYSIPIFVAKFLGVIGDAVPKFPVNSYKISKMVANLTFNCDKAKRELNWKPRKVIHNFFITK